MESYLFYIGKSALAAGAFYITFLLLFQNQKHFVFNRFYLPVSFALSFVIPLITFTTVKYIEPILSENANSFAYLATASESIMLPEFVFQWYHYLIGLYILGGAGFLFNLLLGHFKAMNIIRFSRLKTLFETEVNITNKDIHPFSFFNKIVISENTLEHPNLKMIVNHENIHVKEKHTFDVLFAELLFIIQWFNPFAWLIKGAIKNNLEYKTDHQITQHSNPQDYQMAMVGLADKAGVAPFLNALNGSQLKNRIIMMKKKTENKYVLLKQLIVLPLLAILVMGLANREIKTEIIEYEKQVEIILDGEDISINNKKLASVDFSKGVDSGDIIEALEIANVSATAIYVLDEKLILYIRTSDYVIGTNKEFEKHTAENIVLNENKLTDEYLYAIDNKNIDKKEIEEKGEAGFKNIIFISEKDTTNKYGDKQPLFVVDGIIVDKIDNILPDAIENMSILKGENATNLYGEKGGNGVILVETKAAKNAKLEKAIMIVDGQIVNDYVRDALNPDDIKSIEVLKNESATRLYGEKAKYGAIVITTKNKDKLVTNDPLIVINGEISEKNVINLDIEEIHSISVLNNKNAIVKFGCKAENGVISVTTKDYTISSDIDLRKFIAKEIRYPVIAQKANREKTVKLSIQIDKHGKITAIDDKPSYHKIRLDEVVITSRKTESAVTGYGTKEEAENARKIEEQLLVDETKRVIEKIPGIDISEFKGKTVGITVRFVLQD